MGLPINFRSSAGRHTPTDISFGTIAAATITRGCHAKGWGWESAHDPELLPFVVERWRHSIVSGEPFEMTFPLRGADGIFRPFLTRVVPAHDKHNKIIRWFGTNVDISAQVAAEQALRAREAQFRTFAQAMQNHVWASSPNGLLDWLNDRTTNTAVGLRES